MYILKSNIRKSGYSLKRFLKIGLYYASHEASANKHLSRLTNRKVPTKERNQCFHTLSENIKNY